MRSLNAIERQLARLEAARPEPPNLFGHLSDAELRAEIGRLKAEWAADGVDWRDDPELVRLDDEIKRLEGEAGELAGCDHKGDGREQQFREGGCGRAPGDEADDRPRPGAERAGQVRADGRDLRLGRTTDGR